MAARRRSELTVKRQYKGKFVTMYENIFKGGNLTSAYPNFWNELFLIKPVVS